MTSFNYRLWRDALRNLGLLAVCLLLPVISWAADTSAARLLEIANGKHRTDKQIARNVHRHPVETLVFLGISNNMTVIEITPGSGWYTSILAPFLRDNGKLYAAGQDPDSKNAGRIRQNIALKKLLDERPDIYDKVITTAVAPGRYEVAPASSADMVLTFRNIHNWQWDGLGRDVFVEMYNALKPGGILGVVEHRADPGMPSPETRGVAYVSEEYAIKLIESAGFKFLGKSEINSNPKDTKDYPRGVWTLPPIYRLGDEDRDKYTAIGESDRFTMKFMKPVE